MATVPADTLANFNKIHRDVVPAIMDTLMGGLHQDFADSRYAQIAKAGKFKPRDKAPEIPVALAITAMCGIDQYLRPNGEIYYSRKWGEHDDVMVLRKARELSHFILLYGLPGTGKTALVEAAYEKVHTIMGTGDTELADFVGGYIQLPLGGFEWVDGPMIKAAEEGVPLFIDEVGLIDPKILSAVYGLMDGRREYAVTTNPDRGVVKAKEGFYVIAATNPNAPGVRLSEALLSRFTIQTEMTTDFTLAMKMGVPVAVITVAKNLNRKHVTREINWSPQMREVLAYRDIAVNFGVPFAVANMIAAAPELDRPTVQSVFSLTMGVKHEAARI